VAGFALVGSIAHDSSNLNEAVAAYQKVLQLDPQLRSLPFSVVQFWRELSHDLIATGRPEEAREGLIAALARRDDAELHFLRAKAEEALGENDAAESSCARAVERDPALGQAWLLLGQIALRKGKPREALVDLERAGKLMPETCESVYALSQAYRRLGDGEKAMRLAKRAKTLRARAFRAPGVVAP
jgi:tetratricopeptide (TPR) repeat protein